jgi:hypothetical protein
VEGRLEGTSASIEASTLDRSDAFALSCGSGASPDIAYEWTAPRTDYYALTTSGSGFDTVLGVLSSCDGPELACNNNFGASPHSEIVAEFERDQRVLVVVDGNLGESGAAKLGIEPVTCPGTDLTGQPLPAELTTVGGPNDHGGACGGDGEPEKTVRFTPPEAGLYRFSVKSSTMAPALYLEEGPRCGGALLGCNAPGSIGSYDAEVTRWLPGGKPLTAIIDGQQGSGQFELAITKLADTCPAYTNLPDWDVDVVLDDTTGNHVLSASCAPAGANGFGGRAAFMEHSYALNIAFGASVSCMYEVVSDAPITLYGIRGGQCGGAEEFCSASNYNSIDGNYVAQFWANESKNGDWVIVIESRMADPLPVTYRVNVMCVA